MKARFLIVLGLLLALGACAPRRTAAQFLGYVSPTTVTSTPFDNVACTGADQFSIVQNIGQLSHILTWNSATTTATSGFVSLQGSADGSTFSDISPVGSLTDTGNAFSPSLTASGYYALVRVRVICTGGNFTVQYVGAAAPSGIPYGSQEFSRYRVRLSATRPENASFTTTFTPPFGNSSGTLVLSYNGAAIANSTATLLCGAVGVNLLAIIPLANALGQQSFYVPPTACSAIAFTYTTGGGGAGTFTADYIFTTPGFSNQGFGFSYSGIIANADTAVKPFTGQFHGLTINTKGTTSTAIIWDGAIVGGVCAGTKIATVDTTAQVSLFYDVQFKTGLCVTTAGAAAANLTFFFR